LYYSHHGVLFIEDKTKTNAGRRAENAETAIC